MFHSNSFKFWLKNKFVLLFTLYTIFWIISSLFNISCADTNAVNTYIQVEEEVQSIVRTWKDKMVNAASYLFFALLTISIVMNFGRLLLTSGSNLDLGTILYDLIRILLVFGFFYWLMTNAPKLLDDVLGEFGDFAGEITGKGRIDPSEMVDIGGQLAFKMFAEMVTEFEKGTDLGLTDLIFGVEEKALIVLNAILLGFLGVFVWVVFVFAAFKMFLAAVGFHFMVYAGLFYLGFAGIELTRNIAVSYLTTLLGMAVNYYGMVLMGTMGRDMIDDLVSQVDPNTLTHEAELAILTAVVAFYMLVTKLPQALGSIIGGSEIGGGLSPAQAAAMATAAAGGTMVGGAKVIGYGVGAAGKAGSKAVQGVRYVRDRYKAAQAAAVNRANQAATGGMGDMKYRSFSGGKSENMSMDDLNLRAKSE